MLKSKRCGYRLLLALAMVASLVLFPLGFANAATQQSPPGHQSATSLQKAFARAASEYKVPVSILLSVSYNQTRWEQHSGQPSGSGAYGIMALTDVSYAQQHAPKARSTLDGGFSRAEANAPESRTLPTASRLSGLSQQSVRTDAAQNIRAGAALLASYERQLVGSTPTNPARWYGAVAKYSGSDNSVIARGFADEVYSTIRKGVTLKTSTGQVVGLPSLNVQPDKSTANGLHLATPAAAQQADCPADLGCQYVQAADGSYGEANRPVDGLKINYIVIHDTEESYSATIKQFSTPGSCCSAHYVIRSSDGQITQMVNNKDISYQAGNYYVNLHSIGIEHEGVAIDGASWYTEPMYESSAELVRYLAAKYNVPLDRAHIIGHDNVPGPVESYQAGMHWDPGPYWNWAYYMQLLGAPIAPANAPHTPVEAGSVVTIAPDFESNQPTVTYDDDAGTYTVPKQPSNFVYLYTSPSFSAPLISDPYLHPDGSPGTTKAYDWGDKAVTGQAFYVAAVSKKWTGIDYAGQIAWFYNPHGSNTLPAAGQLVTPKGGTTSAPVYGRAYPDSCGCVSPFARYPLTAGEYYPITDLVTSDWYPNDQYEQGTEQYYEISYNHRIMWVKTSDVDVVSSTRRT